MTTDIASATRSYDRWLRSQTRVVAADLRLKHQRLEESPFVLLRGTFYRWVQQWPEICGALAEAPTVIAIGDLHVENFGTWRDAEGRLVWGVNDVDEAAPLPYTNDLVRLATSALLAIDRRHFSVSPREACVAILDGYRASLEQGGRPIVLAERRSWLRRIALNELRDPVVYWRKMIALPPAASNQVPRRQLAAAMPDRRARIELRRRVAGVGSLGRPRYVALAETAGGLVAREAKALVPSAAAWARQVLPATDRCERILATAVRSVDPFFAARGGWIVRRLAPDCSRIELVDMPGDRDERKLLRAMGWETANLHLGSRTIARVTRDLASRPPNWLRRAAVDMAAAIDSDWRRWRARRRETSGRR